MRGKGRRKDVSWGIKHRGGQRRRSVLITLVHMRLALMTDVARGRARVRVLNGAAAEQHPSMVVHAGEKEELAANT